MALKEADLLLALSAINRGQIQAVKRAAATFGVPETTLRDRIAGKPARIDCRPNLKKLTELKEEVVIGYILNLILRGFPPSLNYVCNIANRLLSARGAEPISKL